MATIHLDTETYSPLSIQTYGTHRYAEEAEVIMWQYAIEDGEVIVEDTLTTELTSLLADDSNEIVIHNSHFDRTVIRYATGIDIPTSRICDTMACAMAHGLPGGLGQLCDIMGVSSEDAKDKEGIKLIKLFCMPQKDGSRATKYTHPVEWEQFRSYGKSDIKAMRQVYKALPRWNYKGFERELWQLDQAINDRGIRIDMDLASAAIKATGDAKRDYDEDTVARTGGAVISTNQRQALLSYIKDVYGYEFDDLRSSTVRGLLDQDLPPGLLDLLDIRLDASKTSASKYKRAQNGANKDGRLRGILQFAGAARTGRWAGRFFQPQNLPRPSVKGDKLDLAIADLKMGKRDFPGHSVMEVCSSALRGLLICDEGKKLAIADLSNIEGRVLAWLAGEDWKIKAFKHFDSGKGHDLYNLTYSKAFGIPVEDVTDDMRQIGKVMELAFGYQGGVGAWITFASAYGIDLEKLAEEAYDKIPAAAIKEASSFLVWFKQQGKKTYGLSDKAFVVCDSFKRLWREEHSHVVSYWKELENACIKAVSTPGKTYLVGHHKIRRDGTWLRIGLPSGRCMCYPGAELVDGKLAYMGVNQYTRKWSRIKTYGGKLAENITQAVARDILAHGMMQSSKKGYDIVLTVHDEILAEVPDNDDYSADILGDIMSQAPIWAIDLPLAAKGFDTKRYRK